MIQTVYVTTLSKDYASATGEDVDDVMLWFSGISFTIICLGTIWSNLLSSLVFGDYNSDSTDKSNLNISLLCGFNFCPGVTNGTLRERPGQSVINLVLVGFIALITTAVVILLFLVRDVKDSREDKVTSLAELGTSVMTVLKNYKTFLFIPLGFYLAAEQALIMSEFPDVSKMVRMMAVCCVLGFLVI